MTGRHRDGLPYAVVYRRVWDGPARAEAERIDRAWADWTVLYSLGRRCFYAMAVWDGPRPVIVEDVTGEGLEERMREAEMIKAMRLAVRSSPASVRGGVSRRRGETSVATVAEVSGGETVSAGGRSPDGRAA
ncbi:hypothetical protein ACFYY8_12220 [Streptosporangium sp. NPDC001559]|uniref:hypothetical protein n=1 Tax=Streptosporangium sp. NPDC001559 TaxID=3366187 RepID=UPI0036EE01CC